MEPIKKILIADDGKKFYVRNVSEDFHTQFGFIGKGILAKAASGDAVKTNTGKVLFAFEPSFIDSYNRIKRAPQIIPRKDVAAIIAETGIGKDSVVVDAGTGSGALALFLGNIAKKVVTYELRDDFAKVAAENIRFLQMKNILLKNKSVYEGIDEKNVDVVTLDLPEPWRAVDAAAKALKAGGFIVSYSPTTPQVSDFVAAALKNKGLVLVKTIEVIEREWEFNERVVRPLSQQIGHSGFLTFVRKIHK
ncbi:50S ribosomal protein L11 methyltransferase [Candidatus Woesearchaeota archaeon]|nr:50S ribosomal protein L11 methyltransferase [Candidatus Woesearchaeota archaeon]